MTTLLADTLSCENVSVNQSPLSSSTTIMSHYLGVTVWSAFLLFVVFVCGFFVDICLVCLCVLLFVCFICLSVCII